LGLTNHPAGQKAIQALQSRGRIADAPTCEVTNIVIGNNATAVDAAGVEAEHLGYSHAMTSAVAPEGPAEELAAKIVEMARTMRDQPGPDCLITGGEPTVTLCNAEKRGLGGRNQQLALAALVHEPDWRDLALVAGGTDGEDGPTDAAGALMDQQIAQQAVEQGLAPRDYLERNDAYHFFEQVGGLIKTGPTHTNVCDLRVVCVNQ
jgi:glycerate-2-kinase